jgi:c-di-GMP-binding flagellar brake protein YcgR
MAGREKRRTPRVPLLTKVRVETVRGTVNTQARDLSVGGMGIYMHKLPPLESPVTVQFSLPNKKETIEITAEVKYHERGQPGTSDDWMGIRFLRMDSESQTAVHGFVKKNYDSAAPKPPVPPPRPK